jgi:hypothetical protein
MGNCTTEELPVPAFSFHYLIPRRKKKGVDRNDKDFENATTLAEPQTLFSTHPILRFDNNE